MARKRAKANGAFVSYVVKVSAHHLVMHARIKPDVFEAWNAGDQIVVAREPTLRGITVAVERLERQTYGRASSWSAVRR